MTGPPAGAVTPPSTIGMLGGGQLGRYALMAARRMGFGAIVLDPDPSAPAGAIADTHLVAPYDDADALDHLAGHCGVVTVEFENPPASALQRLAEHTSVAPDAHAMAVAQDRRLEKRFLSEHGVPVGAFAVIDTASDVPSAVAAVPFPALLKKAAGGYDGKGQLSVRSRAELAGAWAELGNVPCVLERRLAPELEISVVLARTGGGDVAAYPVAENVHVDGILDVSVVPARVPAALAAEAVACATGIAGVLEYVGVLAVEMFVVEGGVLVNELAPRPHNSGHWTLDAAATDQFAQQVRAVCGLPLGSTAMTAPAAAMANLLGDLWSNGEPDWEAALADPDVRLHLYGKSKASPGRKMGHVTATGADVTIALAAVHGARRRACAAVNLR
ncbi:5-(carboxyamino)imidazole ribonucleotide synthase [soil metagenome]